jgi:alginate O-acetyltransferase complex protein AlgI
MFSSMSYYIIFLLPSAIAYRLTPSCLRAYVIIVSGIVFFIYYSVFDIGGVAGAFCVLIFLWEALFSRLYRRRSVFCALGVMQAIIFLFIFKYWNFMTGLLLPAMRDRLHWQGAFLPIGISFFTFEFIHYAVERWRGRVEQGSVSEYLAFILFFPTMVAGPIKRFDDFLPKLRAHPDPSRFALDWRVGITRILTGLAKKFAIADLLTAMTSNLNLEGISGAPRSILLLWVFAYGMKIYFDFSAYSDIAIGSARLFGLRIPENFNWPYQQKNIALFWTHWHISLSSWLRDYVFIPLGGSRVPVPHIVFNLMVTMLVSGVWHGAGLNFVVWGLWHGALISLHRISQSLFPRGFLPEPLSSFVAWGTTFTFVNVGWAFFCMDLPTALLFFKRLVL